MKLLWAEQAWSDYLHFQSADPKIRDRINDLIKEAKRTPFQGIGKPEPLKGDLKGWWSRRITGDHVVGSGQRRAFAFLGHVSES